jgi:hypothetical protein
VILARFGPLWLFELVLANTATILFWDQVLDEANPAALQITLAALNGAAWIAHEILSHRQVSWLQGRWLPRILAVMALFPLMAATEELALELKVGHGPLQVLCAALLAGALVGMYAFHRQVRSELFFLTLGAACVLTLVTTLVGHVVFDIVPDLFAFLFMPLVLIGEIGLVVLWLRHEARSRGTEDTWHGAQAFPSRGPHTPARAGGPCSGRRTPGHDSHGGLVALRRGDALVRARPHRLRRMDGRVLPYRLLRPGTRPSR